MKRAFRLLVIAARSPRDALFLCVFASLVGTLALAQTNPVPFVNLPLVPTTAAPGGPGFTLTVNGTSFVSGSVVNWNGNPLPTTFVSASQLTAAVPASDIATATTASVSVVNPIPGGGTSNVVFFDVTNPTATLNFASYDQNTNFGLLQQAIIGDFNSDGKQDIAYFGTYETSGPWALICIALGNGDGAFGTPSCSDVEPTTEGFGNLIAGDFNGDGNLDLALPNFVGGTNTVSVYLGNGDGTLQPPIDSAAGPSPYWIVTGDFNGDGKMDLAVLYGGSLTFDGLLPDDEFWILLGNGDGTFQSPIANDLGIASNLINVAAGDFNRDGKLDLVVGDQLGSNYFMAGNGDGTFNPAQPGPAVGENSSGMTSADLNGDGKLDLVLTNSPTPPTPPGFSVLLGNGDGSFQAAVSYAMGTTSGGVSPPAIIDLNGDGKLDVIVSQGLEDIGTGPTTLISVFLGNGDGTFQNSVNLPYPAAVGIPSDWSGLIVGDFNLDGHADVVDTTFFQAQPQNALVVSYLQGFFPIANATPLSLSFALQALGTESKPQTITLTNTGNTTLDISIISVAGANFGDFTQTNGCGSTIASNASCQISVTFTPVASGIRNAAVSILNNGVGKTQTVALTGTGSVGVANASPASLTFSNQYVGTSGLPQTVTVTNAGNSPITVTSVTTSVADFGTSSNCTNTVQPGSNCTISVFFDPTASGTRTGTMSITDNAETSTQTVALSGTGQDFSMSTSGSSSVTVSPGQTARYTVALAPGGGFNQPVELTCSGAPAQSMCSLSSTSVTLNGSSSASVQVTVTTAGNSARLANPADWFSDAGKRLALWLPMCGLPSLVLVGILGRRRRQRGMLFSFLLFGLLFVGLNMPGCGASGSRGGTGGGGTPAGTYNLTVSGAFTSGSINLTHSAKLTLVVQ